MLQILQVVMLSQTVLTLKGTMCICDPYICLKSGHDGTGRG